MRLSKVVITTLIILAPHISPCIAGTSDIDPEYLFHLAKKSYDMSNFEDAIDGYEKIIDGGYENGQIYYNLANAYFKTGALGKAILNYERAKRFIPLDRDLKANLAYAYSLIKNDVFNRPRYNFLEFPDKILATFTIDGLTLLLFFIYLAFVFFIILNIYIKRLKKSFFYTICFIFCFGFLLLTVKIYQAQHIKAAIVTTEEADARFEPFDDAVLHFKVYEGFKIYALKEEDGWLKIKRADGKIGWIKADTCQII